MKEVFNTLHILHKVKMELLQAKLLLVSFVLFFLLICSPDSKAQQDFINGFYMYNPLAFNPAITGVNDELVISGIVREQWTGINGAPNTQYLNAHMPIYSWYDRYDRPGSLGYPTGISTGVMLLNDRIASTPTIEGKRLSRVSMPLAVRVRLNRAGVRLSLGMRVDGTRLSMNLDGANMNDPELVSFPPKYFIDFSTGLYIYHTQWYAGISMTNMRNMSFSGLNYKFVPHYFASAGYAQPINEDLVVRLTTLGTLVPGAPLSVTVTPAVIINQNIETGLTYRYDDMVGVFFAFEPIPTLKIGYWYEYPTGVKSNRIGGTHEVALQLTFDRFKKRIISPRYFW